MDYYSMWVGDCTVAEQLSIPHRKCRLKSEAQPPGNRPIRIGNGKSQWRPSLERQLLGFENVYVMFHIYAGTVKEGFNVWQY